MKKKLMVLSGFSGVGKGTVTEMLLQQYPGQIWLSHSDTDRAPRNRTDCYHFMSAAEFAEKREAGAYLECNCYDGHWYGTPLAAVRDALDLGKTVLLEIDYHGMLQVVRDSRLADTEIITVFMAADAASLYRRLAERGETPEKIRSRLRIAAEEAPKISDYDYVLLNREGEAEQTVRRLADFLYAGSAEGDLFDGVQFAADAADILAQIG